MKYHCSINILCGKILEDFCSRWISICNFIPVFLRFTVKTFVPSLQGMSEEAVRQTRSQKRALEREAAPHSAEPPESENDSKKPRLDPSGTTVQEQSKLKPDSVLPQDGQTRTSTKLENEEEQNQLPLPLVLPSKDDQEGQKTAEPSTDNRIDCNDRSGRVRPETTIDTRSRTRLSEPKASSGILAAGEVKATIKVEVQTGEQPVDMSTSRG